MPNNNRKDIVILLDKSSSMSIIAEETIKSVNQFIRDQKEIKDGAYMVIRQFASEVDRKSLQSLQSIKELNSVTYAPHGNTALYDAIGMTIKDLGEYYVSLPENERPISVVFCIVTDGEENSSYTYDSNKIAEMIAHQRDKYNWQFIYLGANQDAILAASKINIGAAFASSYNSTKTGILCNNRIMSQKISSYRSTNDVSQLAYTAEDRTTLKQG